MREPTERELDAMNREPSETAFERDRERFGPMGWGVVQVRIAGANARTYAYETDTLLTINEWVRLPGNVVNENGGFGIVKAYGRDGYNGPLKKIVEKIPEPDPLMVQMSVVKTKEQAAKIYAQAVAKIWTREDLLELIKVGTARLAQKGIM